MKFEYNETLEQARQRNIDDALREDLGTGDWTAQLVPSRPRSGPRWWCARTPCCAAATGSTACLPRWTGKRSIEWLFAEGADMPADSVVCRIRGRIARVADGRTAGAELPAAAQRHGQRHAAPCARHRGRVTQPARLRHPRHAQDDARPAPGAEVRGACRRRQNQRLALWHGILIKENHIAAAGGVPQVMQQALALNAGVEIQIEVETLDQLRRRWTAGATSVLLDNFPLPRVREAVALTAGKALLEVSGGVTLDRLREIAATGVDRISIGGLTKDVRAVDYSMRVQN